MTLTYPYGHEIALDEYHTDYIEDGEFEYEVEPTEEDFRAFFRVDFGGLDVSAIERLCLEKGAEQQLKRIFDAMPDLDWWRDYLEEDDDFYEFMKERYYEEAMEEANEQ